MSKGLVLVTGVTGFLGTSVALSFLQGGYRVRGTVRSEAKGQEWAELFPDFQDSFEYAVVPDMAADNAFAEAVVGVDYIAHTASPFNYDAKDNEKDMLLPAIRGTTNILEAIKDSTTVKHFVFTSSFAANMDLAAPDNGVGLTYSDDSWNPATYEQAKHAEHPAFVYCASKKLAEEAVWTFQREHQPSWGVTTLCPSMIFGAVYQPAKSMGSLNQSIDEFWQLINGSTTECPPTLVPVFIDVADIAYAHVRAVEVAAARNSRYLLISEHFSKNQVCAYIRSQYPAIASRVPDVESKAPDPHYDTDASKAERELGFKFNTLEKAVSGMVDRLLELESELKAGKQQPIRKEKLAKTIKSYTK